jgi:hypothetical protein
MNLLNPIAAHRAVVDSLSILDRKVITSELGNIGSMLTAAIVNHSCCKQLVLMPQQGSYSEPVPFVLTSSFSGLSTCGV